ncbi:hypothetical protein FKW77_007583 [Venturia effusa]|uniref:Uncharacterized protein n=1 Tax=Venturia effusa TaxID=50376 RepID=A0A517LHK2_9PEZI|nr:hypothetical protein FKW77_007583 [Venturia effusa]
MASAKIRPSKMAKLPEDIQEFLNSLSASRFNSLQNAILPSAYFDFLGLPLELREAIYELVFATETGVITRIDPKKECTVIFTSILGVSRAVHAEARKVLYRTNICKLTINPKKAELGYRLETDDMLPFARFRKVELSILGTNYNIGLDGQKLGSLGSMLPHMVATLALVREFSGRAQSKTITFDFQFGSDTEMATSIQKASGDSWMHEVFYRAQAAYLIAGMRKELAVRAPGTSIISNVEGRVLGLETRYKQHQSIMCRVRSKLTKAHLCFSRGELVISKMPWETRDPL